MTRPTDDELAPRVVVFEETGEERTIVRQCKKCSKVRSRYSRRPDKNGVVSPSGIEHIGVDYGFTACGQDATGDRWWWPL